MTSQSSSPRSTAAGYVISVAPGDLVGSAATIPEALAILAGQLTAQLPTGRVAWRIMDPKGIEHRGTGSLNGRLDLLTIAVDELIEELYDELHRSADGGPRQALAIARGARRDT